MKLGDKVYYLDRDRLTIDSGILYGMTLRDAGGVNYDVKTDYTSTFICTDTVRESREALVEYIINKIRL